MQATLLPRLALLGSSALTAVFEIPSSLPQRREDVRYMKMSVRTTNHLRAQVAPSQVEYASAEHQGNAVMACVTVGSDGMCVCAASVARQLSLHARANDRD